MYFSTMMDLNSKDIQLQYEGFLNSPLLWKSDVVFGLKQFEIPLTKPTIFEGGIQKKLRLGKRVERFVENELKNHKSISILAKNYQIQNKKTTVGELDFILQKNHSPIHLEVIYKFYLYDDTFGNSEIEHWIGPNRNDNLVKKLTKLKEKQLPLLFNIHTETLLEKLKLKASEITQFVYFKAQLFTPISHKKDNFQFINNECIIGFYVRKNELNQLSNCKFFIPSKVNWLQNIQTHTKWLSFEIFSTKIISILENKTSPLCWLKQPNGETQKFFVVWW